MTPDRDGARAAALRALFADKQHPRLEEAMHLALAGAETLSEVVAGLASKDEVYRYNCFKVALQIGEEQPGALYAHWDPLVEMLGSDNSYHRSIAVQALARLVGVDAAHRFDGIVDRYLAVLDDQSLITARHLAQSAGRIGRARPDLQARITDRLLAIDLTHHDPARKELIKADVIASLDQFFDLARDQARIRAFVERQLASSSPKTRTAAKEFLKRRRE